jgi:hypothetical protein
MLLIVTCAVLVWITLVVVVVALCRAAAAGPDEERLPERATRPRVRRFVRRTAVASADALMPAGARDAPAPLGPAPTDHSPEK